MSDEIVTSPGTPGEQPTRIAFCVTDLDVGGAERMFVELVLRLNRARWSPSVYCLSKRGALADRLEHAGIPVVCFGARNIFHISVVWRLASEFRRLRPQLLQCFLFHANLAGRMAARLASVPIVVCGIRVAERRSRVPLWLDRFTQGCVTHNVCVSRAVADFSIRTASLNPAKVSVIPNGVDFDLFANANAVERSTLKLSDDASVLLFVGRLDEQKGPLILLEAFERLVARHPTWQLLIVGDGPLGTEIERQIERRKLTDGVRLAGWRPDVPQLLKVADLLVLPSLWEGMPNIVLESMASGLPVVVSRVEGTDELIRDGETGFLVTPGSAIDLERRIEAVLNDRSAASNVATAAKQAVKQAFSLDLMASNYEQLYLRLQSVSQSR